jgi:uncharacterized protein (DUF2249 family)
VLVLILRKTGSPRHETGVLDLRSVPRPNHHSLVFASFDALATGELLGLINAHDPGPLNRQFEITRPGEGLWEYIEQGPDLFRIRIERIADRLLQTQAGVQTPRTRSP